MFHHKAHTFAKLLFGGQGSQVQAFFFTFTANYISGFYNSCRMENKNNDKSGNGEKGIRRDEIVKMLVECNGGNVPLCC